MLKRYLYRLYDTITSRGDAVIEVLVFDDLSRTRGSIEGKLRFYDNSMLEFDEVVVLRNDMIAKLRYGYHYQSSEGELIFRYDNAPHYPNLSTYPHHKHVFERVEPGVAPDLSEVLREIDQYLYKND